MYICEYRERNRMLIEKHFLALILNATFK